MDAKLFFQAILKFLTGLAVVSIILFASAGTFSYPQAWLLLALLFIPMFFAGIVMMFKSPDLLRKRLDVREKQSDQKEVIALSGLMFLAAFIAAGLSFRFDFLMLPEPASYAAAAVFLAAYIMYAEVLRENTYLSRTIEVQKGQRVIDTGLYGVVRHPMYSATILLFLSMPLVLGSVISFAVCLMYIPIIAKRIRGEEKLLESELEGYAEYKKRVKYRLIPYIW